MKDERDKDEDTALGCLLWTVIILTLPFLGAVYLKILARFWAWVEMWW